MATMMNVLQYLAAVMILSQAQLVVAIPPPPPTTTTTTSTSPPPQQVYSSGPIAEVNTCFQCMSPLDPYHNMMMMHNMVQLTINIDDICDVALPSVKQCQRDNACTDGDNHPTLRLYNFICQHKTEMKENSGCWSDNYAQGMQGCINSFAAEGPTVGLCQGLSNLMSCVRNTMQHIPQCSSDAQDFVADMIKFSAMPANCDASVF